MMREIDHSIDIRSEEDAFKAFDMFINKWCFDNSLHLIDDDENDGQFIREKIQHTITQEVKKATEPLVEIIKDLMNHTPSFIECYGYKCRLPQCGSCSSSAEEYDMSYINSVLKAHKEKYGEK